MRLRLLPFLFFILIVSACDGDEPTPIGNEMIGAYAGLYSYREPLGITTTITENSSLIISRNADFSGLLNVSLEGFPRIMVLRKISSHGSDGFSGEVYIYDMPSDVGIDGEEIAGIGSFVYINGSLDIIWTADRINTEWLVSFDGSKK